MEQVPKGEWKMKLAELMPEFRHGDVVTHVMKNGVPWKCERPTAHEGVKCPMCGGAKGYKVIDKSGLWWCCREHDCTQRNAKRPPRKQKMPELELPSELRRASFDSWHHEQALAERLKGAVMGKGIVLLAGPNGTGKTYASVAMLKFRRERRSDSLCWRSVGELYAEWLNRQYALLWALKAPDALVLDDLGVTYPTEGFLSLLYAAINERLNDGKLTIVTTNMLPDEIDTRMGGAMHSRLTSGVIEIIGGEDKRRHDTMGGW